MFECFLEERRTGIADNSFEARIDQNAMLGRKLLEVGIGEDQVDFVVPQFGLDKKTVKSGAKKVTLMSTLRSQFKTNTTADESDILDRKNIGQSDAYVCHNGPQFVLPQLSSNSCPTSPQNNSRTTSRKSLDIAEVGAINTGRTKLTRSLNLSSPDSAWKPNRITPVKPSSSQLSVSNIETLSTTQRTNARPQRLRHVNSPPNTPTPLPTLVPKNSPKKTLTKTKTEVTLSSLKSTASLPRPPQRKRPLSQEFGKPVKLQAEMKIFSRDTESISKPKHERPLPAPGSFKRDRPIPSIKESPGSVPNTKVHRGGNSGRVRGNLNRGSIRGTPRGRGNLPTVRGNGNNLRGKRGAVTSDAAVQRGMRGKRRIYAN